ncbi:hypothetical protein [Qipengyuania sp. JC766]|uniref:hypothetical protein n=1 Tax=Qipengyuania sp. JC766 TaxID=3232139 RepID=UPI0034589881
MLGKMIGALVGGKLAQNTRGISGPTGVAAGFIVPAVLRRLSLPGMLAIGAGAYVAKKLGEKGPPPGTVRTND